MKDVFLFIEEVVEYLKQYSKYSKEIREVSEFLGDLLEIKKISNFETTVVLLILIEQTEFFSENIKEKIKLFLEFWCPN